jgi:serine/threonine protein phosphatase PrpC
MSRSLGDKLAHTVGVIPDPDFKHMELDRDKYEYILVAASDGLWDMFNNE